MRISACLLVVSLLPRIALSQDDKPQATPTPPRAFLEVVKGAEAIPGLFALYRTDEKIYIEVRPEQLDQVYLLSRTDETGIGERGFYGSQQAYEPPRPVAFRRVGPNLQLVIRNVRFTAAEGTPIRRAVERSFADSLLGQARIESLPHPERKSVLIDLGAIFLADLPSLGYWTELAFRVPYKFDPKASYFGRLRGYPKNLELETVNHYSVERIPLAAPGTPAEAKPSPPTLLPDPRSMFFHLRYSLSELPPPGYRPRLADDRLGHWTMQIEDFTSDAAHAPTIGYAERWRLGKAEPAAPLSPPQQPIVFWLDRSVPREYRQAIRDGMLWWNAAFERIGFKDALEVREQPEDADWDAADVRYSSVRWFVATDFRYAIGMSRANPFTGEIYDADIGFSENFTRFLRREVSDGAMPTLPPGARRACLFGEGLAREGAFALDLLATRGVASDGPDADRFVKGVLRMIAAHEAGHALGLTHNFRASVIRSLSQVQDPAYTGPLSGSVMDYIPVNLAAREAGQGRFLQEGLGPYDYWAIEYAYKPIDAATPEAERAELGRIAARAAEAELAFADDSDAGRGDDPLDVDPDVNRWDLGQDPFEFARHRVGLVRELWANMEHGLPRTGEGYQVLRRSFHSSLEEYGYQMWIVARSIGGLHHYRTHFGDPGERVPIQPVAAARQREALALLRESLFAPGAFRFPASLLNRLDPERLQDYWSEAPAPRPDYPVQEGVLALQKQVLDRLLHPLVLGRLAFGEARENGAFRLSEFLAGLEAAIWEETAAATGDGFRRSLQREHLRRMILFVLKDQQAPEDARSQARTALVTLRARIAASLKNRSTGISVESRAHLEESAARIDETLRAVAQRTAF